MISDNKIKIDSKDVVIAAENVEKLSKAVNALDSGLGNLPKSNKEMSSFFTSFKKSISSLKQSIFGSEDSVDSKNSFLSAAFDVDINKMTKGQYLSGLINQFRDAATGAKSFEEATLGAAESLSNALLGSGNPYAMIGGLAVKAGAMIYEAMSKPTEAEIQRKKNLEETIAVQNKLHNVTQNVYKAYYGEITKGMGTLTKLKKLETDTSLSIGKRTEATKELIKEMSELTGKSEIEIQQLLKTKDGYDILTESIMKNALAKAQLAQYEQLLTERMELTAQLRANEIRDLELASEVERVGRRKDADAKDYLKMLTVEIDSNDQLRKDNQKALELNTKQTNAILKGNGINDNIDKTTKEILEAIAKLQIATEKNSPNSTASVTSSRSPTRFKDVEWRTLLTLYTDPTQKLSLSEYALIEKEIQSGIKKEREVNAKALGKVNAEDMRLLEEYRIQLEKRTKELGKLDSNRIRRTVDLKKDNETLAAFLTYMKEEWRKSGTNVYIDNLLDFVNANYNSTVDAFEFVKQMEDFVGGPNGLKVDTSRLGGLNLQSFIAEVRKKQSELLEVTTSADNVKNIIDILDRDIKAIENKAVSESSKENRALLSEAEAEYTQASNQIVARKESLVKNLLNAVTDAVKAQQLPLELLNNLDEITTLVNKEVSIAIKDNIKSVKDSLTEFNTLFGREIAKVSKDGMFIYDPNDIGNLLSGLTKVGDIDMTPDLQKTLENLLDGMDTANRITQSILSDQQNLLIDRIKEWAEANSIKYLRTNALTLEKNELELEKRLLIHSKILEAVDMLSQKHIDNVNLGLTSVRNARKELEDDFNVLMSDYKEVRQLQFENNEEILKQNEYLKSLYKSSIYSTSTSNKELEKAAKDGDASAAVLLNQRNRVGNLITVFNDETNTKLAEYVQKQKEADEQLKQERLKNLTELMDSIDSVWGSTSQFGDSVLSYLDVLSQNVIDRITDAITDVDNKLANSTERLATLESELEKTRSGRREATLAAIEIEKQRERELAAEKLKLQNKLMAEEKKANQRRKIWSISQTLIDGALSIAKLFVNPTPTSPLFYPLLGLTTATTAANVATIASQKFRKGGYTSGRIDETGRRIAGVVHQNEYVVPENLLMRKDVGSMIESIESIRNGGNSTPSMFNTNDALLTEFRMLRKSIDENNNKEISVKVDEISNALNTKSVKVKSNSL